LISPGIAAASASRDVKISFASVPIERFFRDQVFRKREALEPVGWRRRIAAERAGFDVDGLKGIIALGHALGLIDGDEARRLSVDCGGSHHIVDGLPSFRTGYEQHIDLQSFDRLGDVARIDQRDLHLIERNAIVAEHDVQEFRGRRVAGDHADAWPASFETLSSLLASASALSALLSASPLLSASLSVALSAFLPAALSALLTATLAVLSAWSLLSFFSFLAPFLYRLWRPSFYLCPSPAWRPSLCFPERSLLSAGGRAASFFGGAGGGCVGTISAITFWRKRATTGQSGESPSVLGKTARSASPSAIAAALAFGPSVATRWS
jgi:hypothetical protein